MLLTRLALGQAVRTCIINNNMKLRQGADFLGIDYKDLTRAYSPTCKQSKRPSQDRMLQWIDRLGYEIQFVIVRKSDTDHAREETVPTIPSYRHAEIEK